MAMLIVLLVGHNNGLDNGLGLRPQLGFNSWNSFGEQPDRWRCPLELGSRSDVFGAVPTRARFPLRLS